MRGTVAGAGRDGDISVYHVISFCGCGALVAEAALIDLTRFPDVPSCAFAEAGRA